MLDLVLGFARMAKEDAGKDGEMVRFPPLIWVICGRTGHQILQS
jgi:hypothetical protein